MDLIKAIEFGTEETAIETIDYFVNLFTPKRWKWGNCITFGCKIRNV